jgi:hypothetical protein
LFSYAWSREPFSVQAAAEAALLAALVDGLATAVRRNDGSAAYRYHRRLGFIVPDFDTNPTVSEALERLLSASSQWLATSVAERHDAEQPVLDLVERINELLGITG